MRNKPKVYLAGGLSSKWQLPIIDRFQEQFVFFNPGEHLLERKAEYTAWDIHYVKECDILFAYMERDNPSGYGLTLEVGIARALDKTIILVDERSEDHDFFAMKFRIVRQSSSIVFEKLEDGLNMLQSFSRGVY